MIKPKILDLAIQFIDKPREECEKINRKGSHPVKKREFESAYNLSRIIPEIEAIKSGEIIRVGSGWRVEYGER